MVRITSNLIRTIIIVTLLTMLIIPGTVGAQTASARLSGIVWDPSDNPTPGVILTAVDENTGWQYETVSDENGRYLFLALRPGFYTVSTKAKGFQQITRRNIYLPANGNVTESFTLDIAAADETISIEERANIYNSDTYGDISRKDLETLPLFSRNPLILAVHLPGLQINGGDENGSTANGARKGMNHISIDGLTVSNAASPRIGESSIAINTDTVETLHLITSGAKAEFGRSAGAQLGLVSRTGGRSWHGDVYYYHSNKSLNANDFINNSTGIDNPNFRQNIFGATVSGPLWNKRTLIFGNYEGFRMGSEIGRNRLVLMDDSDDDNDIDDDDIINDEDTDVDGDGIIDTSDDDIEFFELQNDEARAGVFRYYTPGSDELQSYDIIGNDAVGMAPEIEELLALTPSPNNILIGDGLNTGGYLFNNPFHNNADRATIRIDHTLNSNHRAYLRLNWSRNDATDLANNADAPFPDTPGGTIEDLSWAVAAGSRYTVNPQMVNELSIGYIRSKTELIRPARSMQSMYTIDLWTNPLSPDTPKAYITPFFEISDSIAHSWNKHTFKYGASYRRSAQKSVDYTGVFPDITFGTSMGNNVPEETGPYGNTVISDEDRQTFENLYNTLLGRIESINQTYYYDLTSPLPFGSARERNYSSFELSAFIQDDWRILPNLTLNLGLRYEFNSVPNEQNDLQRVLDPSSGIDSTTDISDFTLVAGNEWRSRNISNFAPRAGFAWDISGYGSFILRGSYGIYYDRHIGAITDFMDANTYGFSQTASTYPNIGGDDFRLGDPVAFPTTPEAFDLMPPATRSASIAVLDPDLRTPRIDRFNLTLERRLGSHLVFEASYIGARGKNLYQNLNYNQTKTRGDFLQAFQEIADYRELGVPVPESNTLLQLFGSPMAVLDAVGGYYFDTGQAGTAADIVDTGYYDLYPAAGVSDFYLRNYPQFNRFIVGTDTGRSWYDALQFGFRANSSPFRMRAYYTWSKSLDTLSKDGAEFTSPSDSLDPTANKAPSDFDRTHIINVMSSFNIPFGRDRRYGSESSRVTNWIFGDWEVGLLTVWESGRRFSVTSGMETLFADVYSLADYEGNHNIYDPDRRGDGVYWFSRQQVWDFSSPSAGEKGNSGRNSFKGPKYLNLDLTFFKPFHVGDNNQLQVRAEIYNLFNRTHFGVPITDLSDEYFGKFTSTIGTPRMIQLALRYEF
ncbi:MAG: TonB-dependent receptor [Acidobacteria bacterium]|nr:TonB-dependent receptor [Acidobacteriota bacterium]